MFSHVSPRMPAVSSAVGSQVWRPTVAEIDLCAVRHNVRQVLQFVSPARVMAVVKADGYGHGDVEVAKGALEAGASYLGVATLEEGVALRRAQIEAPILVFGGFFQEHSDLFLRYNLEATIFERNHAEALNRATAAIGKSVNVHINIDTGMGRVGVAWQQAVNFVQQCFLLSGLNICGIYTHFACADARDKEFTYLQLRRFREVLSGVTAAGFEIPLKHTANSAAILDVPESAYDLVRLGVSMYGYYPSNETSESIPLKPAMTLKSRVLAVKKIAAGGTVGYNRTFKAEKDTRVALIPIGYADGYNRKLSNKGAALIRGIRYRVAGTISMDQIMIEVGLESPVEVGDEVVLMGKQGEVEVSIYEICRILETIPYEVVTGVSKRVPRNYVGC